MTNGDPERRIFLSHPNANNGFFFLLTIEYSISKRLHELSEYAEMRHDMMTSL